MRILYLCNMKTKTLIILTLLCCQLLVAQTPLPKHEVRAAWVTVVYGLDWPKAKATNADGIRRQQAELIDILDKLKMANFNTVLFQARTRGDVIYKSAYEPYNSILTGRTAGNPGYDPLAFVVEECHKRGMECHAWIVAIPLGNRTHVNSLGNNSVTKKRPSIVSTYKREYFLNPGHPDTKKYLMDITREIVQNYDVDGVHYDYLRYPENAPQFPDRNEYRKYGNGREINQWRRDNISEIVRYIYQGVKALKPWVKVSTSPVGKYDDTTRYPSRSWNAYDAVKQDVVGWLSEGIQDQIYPMMYFKGNNFYPFALDWKEQSNGRQVIPGLGIYFLDPKEGDWSINEVERQIRFSRNNGLAGQAHYRVKYLMDNVQGLYDLLQDELYTAPALPPASPWLDNVKPSVPKDLQVQTDNDGYTLLKWEASTDNDTQNAPLYVIYGSDTYPVDTQNPANIIAQRVKGTSYTYAPVTPWSRKTYFAVTAIDRYGNESEATQMPQ